MKLANPTMTCSGTCGYAFEYADFMDLSKLGAFVTKSITREERAGNEPTRIVETRAGMLNAIGLANVGLDRFLKEKVPLIRKMPCPVIVNVAGHSFDDYAETCGATLTYAELRRRVLAIAARLQADGLSGGCALLLYPTGPLHFIEAFLGCLAAGVIRAQGTVALPFGGEVGEEGVGETRIRFSPSFFAKGFLKAFLP